MRNLLKLLVVVMVLVIVVLPLVIATGNQYEFILKHAVNKDSAHYSGSYLQLQVNHANKFTEVGTQVLPGNRIAVRITTTNPEVIGRVTEGNSVYHPTTLTPDQFSQLSSGLPDDVPGSFNEVTFENGNVYWIDEDNRAYKYNGEGKLVRSNGEVVSPPTGVPERANPVFKDGKLRWVIEAEGNTVTFDQSGNLLDRYGRVQDTPKSIQNIRGSDPNAVTVGVTDTGEPYWIVKVGDKTYNVNKAGKLIDTTSGELLKTDNADYERYNQAQSAYQHATKVAGTVFYDKQGGAHILRIADDGTNIFYKYDEKKNKWVKDRRKPDKILLEIDEDRVSYDAAQREQDRERDERVERRVGIMNYHRSTLRMNLLNEMFSLTDNYIDYSFKVPQGACDGSEYSNFARFSERESEGTFLFRIGRGQYTSQSDALEQQLASFMADMRVKAIYGERYEVLEDAIYRYDYTMKVLFNEPGVRWRTFLRNHCDYGTFEAAQTPIETDNDLLVFEGTSSAVPEGSISGLPSPLIKHFAGSAEGSDNPLNLGNVRCENENDKCKFDMACVTLYYDEDNPETYCNELSLLQPTFTIECS